MCNLLFKKNNLVALLTTCKFCYLQANGMDICEHVLFIIGFLDKIDF